MRVERKPSPTVLISDPECESVSVRQAHRLTDLLTVRQRERERGRDRQTDRRTDGRTDGQTDSQSVRHTDRQTGGGGGERG